MNNGLVSTLSYVWKKWWVKAFVIMVPILLLVWYLVSLSLQPEKLATQNINLTSDNLPKLVEGKIAAYNGSSFYTIDPVNGGGATIVYTPSYRLPSVSSITWAGLHGVLLNFSSGVMNTPVKKYLQDAGLSVINSDYFTWYLNFNDGSLSLVEAANVKDNLAIYSPTDNGFYYVPSIKYSDIDASRSTLKFYDISSKSSKEVVSNLDLNISSMNICSLSGAHLCVVGRGSSESYGKTHIYSISQKGEVKTILTNDGEIYPTPTENTYAVLSKGEEYMGTSTLYSTISIKNIATSATQSYNGKIFGGNVVVGILNGYPYVLDGKNSEYLYLHSNDPLASTQVGQLSYSNDSSLSEGYSALAGQSDANSILIASSSAVFVVGGSATKQTYLKAPYATADSAVKACAAPIGATYQYSTNTFTVYINDDSSFSTSISAFKQCIATPEASYGYNYSFRGVSPVNGRISTD